MRPCVAIESWLDAVVSARPFDSVAALAEYAEYAASLWTTSDVEHALADHPRIGERHSGSGASATMSSAEQSGVSAADDDVAARLADGNTRYEKTFGRIYLVRAAGRSAEEMLAMLEERLLNEPAKESDVTAQQLREIALLRLRGIIK